MAVIRNLYERSVYDEEKVTQSSAIPESSDTVTDIPLDETLSFLFYYSKWYAGIHGYVAAIVCILGVIANILNIIVLTQKNMISPSNIILTGLAISDGLTMALYFPFALHQYVIYGTDPSEARDTLGAARFLFAFAICSVVVHSISIWLTVTLALFRYIFIKYPRQSTYVCTIQRAQLSVVAVTIVTTVVCMPNSATLEIKRTDNASTTWYINYKENTEAEKISRTLNFWVQAILVKLVPCVFLTVLSILLVKAMKDAERRRKRLQSRSARTDDDGGRERKTNRTTKMLLAVVVLFLVTEIPQGVLNILSGSMSSFFELYYGIFADTLDILTLINNGINFILYCTMSKQFRDTFIRIFFKTFIVQDRQLQLVSPQATRYTEVWQNTRILISMWHCHSYKFIYHPSQFTGTFFPFIPILKIEEKSLPNWKRIKWNDLTNYLLILLR